MIGGDTTVARRSIGGDELHEALERTRGRDLRRMRPVLDPLRMAVLDRVEVDVVGVAREITVIPQGVLPIPSLPNSAFASARPAR